MLVSVDIGEYDAEQSIAELAELVDTAGGETVIKIIQKRPTYDSASCIGSGMLAEIADKCKELDVDQIIFDS